MTRSGPRSARPPCAAGVRLGTPDDYALRYLPQVLKRFADTHPSVEVEVICAPSSELVTRLHADELDLTLCSEGHEPAHWPSVELWRGPLTWITLGTSCAASAGSVAACVGDRRLRVAGRRRWTRCHEAGRRCRIAYSSATFSGTYAPVLAGLAVTASPITFMPGRAPRHSSGRGAAAPAGLRDPAAGGPRSPAARDRGAGAAHLRDLPRRNAARLRRLDQPHHRQRSAAELRGRGG